MKMKKLHLDNEYRNRWEEFELEDGTIEDSRNINWRNVEWNKVISITVFMAGKVHKIEKKKGHKGFMNFRWGGREAQFENGEYSGHKTINIWTIGWTDGKECYLKDIDFYTGEVGKQYKTPLKEFKNHIHPLLNL